MNKNNGKIEISAKEILSKYFYDRAQTQLCAYTDRKPRYIQTLVNKELSELDVSNVVSNYGVYLSMFLGANCSNINKSDLWQAQSLFLGTRHYSICLLSFLNSISNQFFYYPESSEVAYFNESLFNEEILDINLEGNDFGVTGFEWDLGDFINAIREIVDEYLDYIYGYKLRQIAYEEEQDMQRYGIIGITADWLGEGDIIVEQMDKVRLNVLLKLVPNLQNTNLKIVIDMKKLSCDMRIVEAILQQRKFDNCFIKVVNGNLELMNKLGLTTDYKAPYYSSNMDNLSKKRS